MRQTMNAVFDHDDGRVDDQAEVERFSALAEEWWDPRGKMAPLHKFNPVRLGYIRDRAAEHFGRDPKKLDCLKGLRVLDIGCGGGLLSEPLARLGASMVGVDPSERNVEVAKLHAEQSDLQIAYRSSTAEQLSADGEKFDLVLAMDEDNLAHLEALRPADARAELRLLLDYVPDAGRRSVPDPYYGGAEGFERVLNLVERAADGLIAHLAATRR